MKNKKLLLLILFPVIISILVLPLCSFTTIYNENSGYYISSVGNYCVPYVYRSSATATDYYYGMINNASRAYIPQYMTTVSQINSSIKTSASDYYMVSDTRITIDNTPTKYYIDDIDDSTRLSLSYSTNKPAKCYFPSRIYAESVNLVDDARYTFIKDGYILDLSTYSRIEAQVKYSITYYYVEDGSLHMDDNYFGFYLYDVSFSNPYFDVYDFMDEYMPDYVDVDYDIITKIYNYVDIQLFVYDNSDNLISEFDSVILDSEVRPYGQDGYLGFLPIFNELGDAFEVGYDKGYDAGINLAPGAWEDVGDFLTSSIGAFTNAEIFPGFTLGGVLAIVAGALLLLFFLKMFAGG